MRDDTFRRAMCGLAGIRPTDVTLSGPQFAALVQLLDESGSALDDWLGPLDPPLAPCWQAAVTFAEAGLALDGDDPLAQAADWEWRAIAGGRLLHQPLGDEFAALCRSLADKHMTGGVPL